LTDPRVFGQAPFLKQTKKTSASFSRFFHFFWIGAGVKKSPGDFTLLHLGFFLSKYLLLITPFYRHHG
jgi:hypothetical protein